MSIPNYAAVCSRPDGRLAYAWTDNNRPDPQLVFSDFPKDEGTPYASVKLDAAALFLDLAADDDRAMATWQDHSMDLWCGALDSQSHAFVIGDGYTAHGTQCAIARLNPRTGRFQAWVLEQVIRGGQKTTERYVEWDEGAAPLIFNLPPSLIGTSQGFRDVLWNPGTQQFDVLFMDSNRSLVVLAREAAVQLTLWQDRDGFSGQADNNADGTGVAVVDHTGDVFTVTTEGTPVQPKMDGTKPNRVMAVSALSNGRVRFIPESEWVPFVKFVAPLPEPRVIDLDLPEPPQSLPAIWIGTTGPERGPGNASWSATDDVNDPRPAMEMRQWAETIENRPLLCGLWLSDNNRAPETIDAEIAFAKARGAKAIYIHEDENSSVQQRNVEAASARVRAAGLEPLWALHVKDQRFIHLNGYTAATLSTRTPNKDHEWMRSNVVWLVEQMAKGHFQVVIFWGWHELTDWPKLKAYLTKVAEACQTPKLFPGQVAAPAPVPAEPPPVSQPKPVKLNWLSALLAIFSGWGKKGAKGKPR